MMADSIRIRELDAAAMAARETALARLLCDCVAGEASLGFIQPFRPADAARYWRGEVASALGQGRRLWAAEDDAQALLGVVQLDPAAKPNQAHRAEVMKLLTAPAARRRGVARALMARLEAEALAMGRTLLTLDTRTGSEAEPLYTVLGYERVGVIPDFCRHPSEDRLEPTTIFYKRLG